MTVATWVAAVAVIAIWVVFAVAVTEGDSGFSGLDWFGVAWKTGLVQLAWVALGLAAIAWIRSTGLAIGAVIAFSFVDGFLVLWETYRDVSLSAATTALFGEITADVSSGFGIGFTEPMSFTHALIVVLVWALAATIAAYAGLVARDA